MIRVKFTAFCNLRADLRIRLARALGSVVGTSNFRHEIERKKIRAQSRIVTENTKPGGHKTQSMLVNETQSMLVNENATPD